jgi:DNA polymerase-3 subunit alpha
MELQKVMRKVEIANTQLKDTATEDIDEFDQEVTEPVIADVEDIQVMTKLSMPSRKLKVKISNELLHELEKLQVNFKLN